MKLAADDRIVAVFPGWDDYELLLVTAQGQGIRFPEAEVRPVGRSAGAIRGIRLKAGDRVVGGCAVAHEEIVVIATAAGFAKRTAVDEFPVQARGGSGVKAAKVDKARGGASPRWRPRPKRSRSSRPTARSPCRAQSVRAAARDGGGSKVTGVSGEVQRIVAVVAHTRAEPLGRRVSRSSSSRGRRDVGAEVLGDVHEVVGRSSGGAARTGAGSAACRARAPTARARRRRSARARRRARRPRSRTRTRSSARRAPPYVVHDLVVVGVARRRWSCRRRSRARRASGRSRRRAITSRVHLRDRGSSRRRRRTRCRPSRTSDRPRRCPARGG